MKFVSPVSDNVYEWLYICWLEFASDLAKSAKQAFKLARETAVLAGKATSFTCICFFMMVNALLL